MRCELDGGVGCSPAAAGPPEATDRHEWARGGRRERAEVEKMAADARSGAVAGGGTQARVRLARGWRAAAVAFCAVWKRLWRFKGHVAGWSPLIPYINGEGIKSAEP